MAEADLVFFTKSDLYAEHPDLLGARIRSLSARSGQGVAEWLDEILAGELAAGGKLLDIDYARYARAEAALSWLNCRAVVSLHLPLSTYRSDLRELNELNFSRFDAKLEQRVAELRAELRGSLRALEGGLSALEARMEARFEAFEGKLVGRFESRIAEVRTEMQRWMLASWASMMLVLLGTLFAVLRTR